VVQGGVSEIPKKRGWSLEQDHIFPNSVLTKLGVPDQLRDAVGNLRFLAKARNILKSADISDASLDFYGSDQEELHSLFVMAAQNLTVESFTAFCTARQRHIFKTMRRFLGFGPSVPNGLARDHSI
jgi:hypothetical protein